MPGRHRQALPPRLLVHRAAAVVLALGGAGLIVAAQPVSEEPAASAWVVEAAQAGPAPAAAARTALAVAESTAVPAGPRRGASPPADAPSASAADVVATPEAVRIPAIGVSSRLVDLGLQEDQSLEVPTNADDAGWFQYGPAPGEVGPAVLAGHVDSAQGPGVFYRLSELRRGDVVLVDQQDGSTAKFTVEAVAQYPKANFPTDDVYGWVDHAALRLLTCGGVFDYATGHYRDNIVVYARLIEAG